MQTISKHFHMDPRGDTTKAADLLQRAVELAPHSLSTRFHWAMALSMSGKNSDSRRILEQLLEAQDPFAERQEAKMWLERAKKEPS